MSDNKVEMFDGCGYQGYEHLLAAHAPADTPESTSAMIHSLADRADHFEAHADHVRELVKASRLAESAFVRIIQLAEAYVDQGQQWSRIDANGVIAEMYAATNPVSVLRAALAHFERKEESNERG